MAAEGDDLRRLPLAAEGGAESAAGRPSRVAVGILIR